MRPGWRMRTARVLWLCAVLVLLTSAGGAEFTFEGMRFSLSDLLLTFAIGWWGASVDRRLKALEDERSARDRAGYERSRKG